MAQRITKAMLQKRIDILNDVFGYDREPYSYYVKYGGELTKITSLNSSVLDESVKKNGKFDECITRGNYGTFKLESVSHIKPYRLCQMACPNGGTGERDLSPPGTARETYDVINAWIDSAEQMKRKMES